MNRHREAVGFTHTYTRTHTHLPLIHAYKQILSHTHTHTFIQTAVTVTVPHTQTHTHTPQMCSVGRYAGAVGATPAGSLGAARGRLQRRSLAGLIGSRWLRREH